jgi:two-component system cell cycle response regulator
VNIEPIQRSHTEALGEGIYAIGDFVSRNSLASNTYLIIDSQGTAVLIDPGPIASYPLVLENILSITSLDKIKYVILHHPDPDIYTTMPLFEQIGLNAQIVTSWPSMLLIQSYQPRFPFYIIENNNMVLPLPSGRTLNLIHTPYLNFPGSFTTYDPLSKSLFSSDFFGAFAASEGKQIYADETYLPRMLAFHEHYMPSNSVLRPVMDMLSLFDIHRIAPQHGSILTQNIPIYIEALRNLECGSLMNPLKKKLLRSGGYLIVFNELQHRLFSLYPYQEVVNLFRSMPFLEINDLNEIKGYSLTGIQTPENTPDHPTIGGQVWNAVFTSIQNQKGMAWLTTLEPFVKNLCESYDLTLPNSFLTSISEMASEIIKLQEINSSLDQTIQQVNDRLVKDPITGLFNENFLRSLLLEEFTQEDWRDVGSLVTIGIDDFADYQGKMGVQQGNNVLNNMAYMLKEVFSQNTVFRLTLAAFGLYLKNIPKDELINKLEQFRSDVAKSELFLGQITISAGIVFPSEIELDASSLDLTMGHYFELAFKRLRHARIHGKNRLCFKGEDAQTNTSSGKVLLVDTDATNIALLKNFLNEDGIEVFSATNGIQARDLAFKELPSVIVTEIILNQMDGFALREELLRNSDTKNIETVFLSFKKDDESVRRAINLGVTSYVRKPYLLSELLGIIKRAIQGRNT